MPPSLPDLEACRTALLGLLLVPILSLIPLARVLALTTPDDLCTGDPCVISSNKTVEDGSVIDFGTRDVILRKKLDVGSGSMTLRAGSFTMEDVGKLDAKGASGSPGGVVVIETVNDILIGSTPSGGAANLNGKDAGALLLRTTAGSVTMTSSVKINIGNSGNDASGGKLTIISGGAVNLAGEIMADGGPNGGGGTIEIVASGDISVTGPIDVGGGQSGGGLVDLEADGSVTVGPVMANGGSDGGVGGSLEVNAGGSITLTGAFQARGAFGIDSCGDGGEVDLLATGDITVQAEIDIDGPGTCSGGSLTMEGANVRLENLISARDSGFGESGSGGDLNVTAHGLLSLTGSIAADGKDLGGNISLSATRDLELQGPIDARGRGTFGSGPRVLRLEAGATLTLASSIDARGGSSGSGGDIVLSACALTVNPGVLIQADGSFGSISMFASDVMTVPGVFSAGPVNGSIDVFFGLKADPPDTAGATFNIQPSVALEPFLAVCDLGDCNDGIDNDGDGLIDDPNDPGCDLSSDPSELNASYECDDGIDNDGDGLVDAGGDPGCGGSPTWTWGESPECSDGIDNDGDGEYDFDGAGLGPPDSLCVDAADYDEATGTCGIGGELLFVLPPLMWLHGRLRRKRRRG